jgi:hypothetical protein
MDTSSTGIRRAASSITRWSMPSYRPQAKTSHGSAAYSTATAWVNGRPAGVGTTRRAPSPHTVSSASPHTCGFITIPGPPP